MNRRALIITLIVIAFGAFVFLLYQRRFEREAAGGESIKVLVATKSIERDKPITEDMLTTREIPQAYVEDRAIKEVEKTKIVGRHTNNYIHVHQTLLWTDVVNTDDEKHDLSSFVQTGNRAVNVRLAENDGTLIHSGDYVDIISLVKEPGRPNPKGAERAAATPMPKPGEPIDLMTLLLLAQQRGPTDQDAKAAVVLLQRVLVLAVDARGPQVNVDVEVGKKRYADNDHGTLLTLSLTLPEAQLLALAAEKGVIAVAVRNRDDQRIVERIPDVTSAALLEPGVREALRGYRHGGGPMALTAPVPAPAVVGASGAAAGGPARPAGAQ